ncbi:Dynein light chain Tctex-type 3 [Lemmus lemmus]
MEGYHRLNDEVPPLWRREAPLALAVGEAVRWYLSAWRVRLRSPVNPSLLRRTWILLASRRLPAPESRRWSDNSGGLGDRKLLGAVGRVWEDPVGFNAEEAQHVVKECVDAILGGEDYNQDNINQWTASIVEQSISHLVKLGKSYKYIVTCAVAQKSAYGFHTASSCFWDTTSDGTCSIRWENRTMNCIVTVFAIAIVL